MEPQDHPNLRLRSLTALARGHARPCQSQGQIVAFTYVGALILRCLYCNTAKRRGATPSITLSVGGCVMRTFMNLIAVSALAALLVPAIPAMAQTLGIVRGSSP